MCVFAPPTSPLTLNSACVASIPTGTLPFKFGTKKLDPDPPYVYPITAKRFAKVVVFKDCPSQSTYPIGTDPPANGEITPEGTGTAHCML